jgi:hypothetical protein
MISLNVDDELLQYIPPPSKLLFIETFDTNGLELLTAKPPPTIALFSASKTFLILELELLTQ